MTNWTATDMHCPDQILPVCNSSSPACWGSFCLLGARQLHCSINHVCGRAELVRVT